MGGPGRPGGHLGLPLHPGRPRNELTGINLHFFVSDPKAISTSLRFSLPFLLCLGSLLGSLLEFFGRLSWLKLGPSRLSKPYLFDFFFHGSM